MIALMALRQPAYNARWVMASIGSCFSYSIVDRFAELRPQLVRPVQGDQRGHRHEAPVAH
jgi:hypothetical protein